MTTYEQMYGRYPDGLADVEEPPEDWQFENPIVRQTITGRKEVKVPKLDLAAILPRPKETTEKEAITMKFADFDLDKQARLVAEEYNKKTTITEIREKFDLNVYKLYKLLDHAKSIGIPVTMRGSCTQSKLVAQQKKQAPVVPEEAIQTPVVAKSATADDFANAAQARLEQAEKLAKEAERLQQAGKIALAIEELLKDRADKVIAVLYSEVAV